MHTLNVSMLNEKQRAKHDALDTSEEQEAYLAKLVTYFKGAGKKHAPAGFFEVDHSEDTTQQLHVEDFIKPAPTIEVIETPSAASDTSQPKQSLADRAQYPRPQIDIDPDRSWMKAMGMRGGWNKTLTIGLPQRAIDLLLMGDPKFDENFADIVQNLINNNYFLVPIDLSRSIKKPNEMVAMCGVNYHVLQGLHAGDFDLLIGQLRNRVAKQMGMNFAEDVPVPQGHATWMTTMGTDYTGNDDHFDKVVTVNLTQGKADGILYHSQEEDELIDSFMERLQANEENFLIPLNMLEQNEKPSHTYMVGLNRPAVEGLINEDPDAICGLLSNARKQIRFINRKHEQRNQNRQTVTA